MDIEIVNAGVDMVEYGWQELVITHKGKEYIIEVESEESPNKGGAGSSFFWDFRSKEDRKLAQKIGFELTDAVKEELRFLWDSYSNEHFRG